MIGRMRPFYQAHWDISNDIKHVWLLFCTYYIAWIFLWILGDEGMMRPSVQGVDHPVCCVLDAAVTYARDSSCWFQEGLLSSLGGGGGQTYWHKAYSNNCLSVASHNDSAPHGFLQARDRLSTQSFPENAGPYGRSFASTSVGSASHATHPTWWPIWLKQGVSSATWCHGRHHVMVTLACVSTLACWRDLLWLKQGVILAQKHRRKVVTKDASNKGWGAMCEGKSTFGLWSEEELGLHINCLEMKAVCNACQFFLPDIRRHHVLVRSDSRSVMSYINRQSGLILNRLGMLANGLLVWGQTNMRSLKATHVPRKINEGADLLSRNNVSSEEWMLHPSQFRKPGKSLAELE